MCGGGGTEWRMTADAAVPSCPYRAKHVQHVSLSVFTAPHTHRQAQSKTQGGFGGCGGGGGLGGWGGGRLLWCVEGQTARECAVTESWFIDMTRGVKAGCTGPVLRVFGESRESVARWLCSWYTASLSASQSLHHDPP